ncbi:uncharacterized protein FTOL_12673 [Fusarium torulosum]|uniref:Uncharacterized protein n=1 Tax=Fusarium torulosum TaxID=33205 RepID=A0AAE8SP74_9HYPO|nr:uncharacterized protein FTOL_12673 [Fusarium torulosum]
MPASTPMPETVALMGRLAGLDDTQPSDKAPQVEVVPTPTIGQDAVRIPFWLTKPALILFFSTFVACAASLIILDRFMEARHGLPLNLSSSEYSWTYGPTALLVVILSFWRRIDYYYKSVQPWRELQHGPVQASRSVLLDYLSPLQLQSMFRAFTMSHYPVAATILSFFLLKIIILVSTTLFVVQPALHSETLNVTYQDSFKATKVWAAPYRDTFISPDSPVFSGRPDKYVWKYLARLNDAVANDSAWNVKDGLVTQQFRSSTSPMNLTSLEAPVDVFVPEVTCENASLLVDMQSSGDWVDYSWKSKTCTAGVNEGYLCPDHKARVGNASICGTKPWAYALNRVNCSRGIDIAEASYMRNWTAFEDFDIRYAITAAQYSIDMDVAKKNVSLAIKLINSSAIICKVNYGIVSANARQDLLLGSTMISKKALKGKGRQIGNLTSSAMAEMLMSDLDTSAEALVAVKDIPIKTKKESTSSIWEAGEALFQLMVVKLGERFEPGIFMEPSVLQNTSITVLQGLLNEFARDSLLVETRAKSTAIGIVSEARLRTRTVAVWLMVAGFCILAIISLLLVFSIPKGPWVPAFCGSIAGHAAVLVNSPNLVALLRDSGHSTEKDLIKRLEGIQFIMNRDGTERCGIDVIGQPLSPDTTTSRKNTTKWKAGTPITGRRIFMIATLALPIIAIGILELLQQLSNQNHGLLDIYNTDSVVLSYIVRIASTGAVFLIATMFNSADFTTVTFAPYSALRTGNNPADRTVLFNLLSVSPFLVIFKSLCVGQIGPAASNLSALLGSLLTIIVSGLWILNPPSVVERRSSATVTNWRTSWLSDAPDDGGAAMLLNLVHYGGTNTSSGIWEDLVFPDVSLTTSHTLGSDAIHRSANYTYTIEALRPFLHCSVIERNNFASRFSETQVSAGVQGLYAALYEKSISTYFLAPYDCGDQKVNNMANISFGLTLNGRGNHPSTLVGHYFDLNTTEGTSNANCPSIGILFAQVGGSETRRWNLTALACTQGIEQIPVNVTYRGDPTLRQINNDFPPWLDRVDAREWTNKTTNTTALYYKLDRFLTADLAPFPTSLASSDEYDIFINHLMYGPNKPEKDDLSGPSGEKTLIRLVERDYSAYMRNVIDLNFRANKNTSPSDLKAASPFSRKQTSSARTEIIGAASEHVTRLAIHATSKLILQVLLAAMAILGLASYLLVKVEGTLPRSPCSIASTMAFLAGSQLCDGDFGIMSQGAEYMTDGHLKEALDGRVFNLGWWQKEGVSVHGSDVPHGDTGASKDMDIPNIGISEGESTLGRFGIGVRRANVFEL